MCRLACLQEEETVTGIPRAVPSPGTLPAVPWSPRRSKDQNEGCGESEETGGCSRFCQLILKTSFRHKGCQTGSGTTRAQEVNSGQSFLAFSTLVPKDVAKNSLNCV